MEKNYRSASVVMAGAAGLIVLCVLISQILGWGVYYSPGWRWMRPFCSLATPILFGWVGVLFRGRWQSPKKWVKTVLVLLVPALYISWTVLHYNGIHFFGDGERCMWLCIGILGYLVPTNLLAKYKNESGIVELVLFLGAAFCYVGISRVENHFGVMNFQMLDNELTRLFCRAMRFVPLAMSVFFLAGFSFSRTGQRLGSSKGIGIAVLVLSAISFLAFSASFFSGGFYHMRLYGLYQVLVQPVTVLLIMALARFIKGWTKR